MRLLRVLRGVVGTALSFAVPWAAIGAAVLVGIELVRPRTHPELHGPVYLLLGLKGAALFGALGAAVGAVFAGALALSGRHLRFEQLTKARVLGLGVAGGVVVSGTLLGVLGMLRGAWPARFSLELGISALLGGASALTMLQIAHRGRSASRPSELGVGAAAEFEPPLVREKARRVTT